MDSGFKLPNENGGRPEENGFGRLLGWLVSLITPNPMSLGAFEDRLVAAFKQGFVVNEPMSGKWFATLDTIDPEDNQIAALVRLSRERPEQSMRQVRRGMVDVEDESRELPLTTPSADSLGNADLLLIYSFPLVFSLDRNLELFREFAGNELGRLRGHALFELAGQSQAR